MLNRINQLDINNLPRILLICGEEEFLIEESLNYVRDNIINTISDEFDRDFFDSADVDLNKVLGICRSFPFMSKTRSIVVKNADKLFSMTSKKADKSSLFANYLESPSDFTFLVMTSSYSGLNGLTKSYASKLKSLKFPFNEIVEKHEWIEYPKIWENQLAQWLSGRLKSKKINITPPALELLISNTNQNLREISSEIEKLEIYIDGRTSIEYEDVLTASGLNRQYNPYELQKAIGQCNLRKSLEIADNIISHDKAEMLIISVITRFMIKLLKLSELEPSMDKYSMASALDVNAFFVQDYKNALNTLGIARVERAIKELATADSELKRLSIDSKNIIQKMIINILK